MCLFASAVYPSGMVLFTCSLVAMQRAAFPLPPTKDGTHGPAVEAESSHWTTEIPKPGHALKFTVLLSVPVFLVLVVDRHFDCFQFGATMNRAAMNIQEQVFAQTFIFISTNLCKYRHQGKCVYLSLQEAIEPFS